MAIFTGYNYKHPQLHHCIFDTKEGDSCISVYEPSIPLDSCRIQYSTYIYTTRPYHWPFCFLLVWRWWRPGSCGSPRSLAFSPWLSRTSARELYRPYPAFPLSVPQTAGLFYPLLLWRSAGDTKEGLCNEVKIAWKGVDAPIATITTCNTYFMT